MVGGDWSHRDLCPCFWTQGTVDAMDCVCVCDGADECESAHSTIPQGPRHGNRLYWVFTSHPTGELIVACKWFWCKS